MTALSKFLVLLAIFLLAGYANAFWSLSQVARNQVQVNSLIQCEESKIQNCKLNWKPTNDQTTNEVQPSSSSDTSETLNSTINQDREREEHSEAVSNVESSHDTTRVNKRVTFSDNLDFEIHNKSHVDSSWPNERQMPD